MGTFLKNFILITRSDFSQKTSYIAVPKHSFTSCKTTLPACENPYFKSATIEQTETLWDKGVLIAELETGLYRYMLYQSKGLYIEVKRHKHFNAIQKVCTFTSTSFLEPYLRHIHIDSLFM